MPSCSRPAHGLTHAHHGHVRPIRVPSRIRMPVHAAHVPVSTPRFALHVDAGPLLHSPCHSPCHTAGAWGPCTQPTRPLQQWCIATSACHCTARGQYPLRCSATAWLGTRPPPAVCPQICPGSYPHRLQYCLGCHAPPRHHGGINLWSQEPATLCRSLPNRGPEPSPAQSDLPAHSPSIPYMMRRTNQAGGQREAARQGLPWWARACMWVGTSEAEGAGGGSWRRSCRTSTASTPGAARSMPTRRRRRRSGTSAHSCRRAATTRRCATCLAPASACSPTSSSTSPTRVAPNLKRTWCVPHACAVFTLCAIRCMYPMLQCWLSLRSAARNAAAQSRGQQRYPA